MINEDLMTPDEEEGIEIPVEFEEDGADPSTDADQTQSEGQEESREEEPVSESLDEAVETQAGPEASGEEESLQDEAVSSDEEACEGSETGDDSCTQEEAGTEEESGEPEAQAGGEAEAASGESGAEAGEDDANARKGIFGFRKKDKEKEKLHEQVKELNDRLLRSMAEFDNFRKRSEKEKSGMYALGAEDIVRKILPVVDSFERGLGQAQDSEDPFAEGMKMIYKQLVTALEEAGVETIDAVGNPFDPNLHNAVMHVDDEELGENVVAEEFQKGYTYKGNVVRHSMVKVAN